jgi:hypothetical protein
MNTVPHEPAQVLNEDLMIVQATLASIVDDVERYSGAAARAVNAAIRHVHAAQHTLAGIDEDRAQAEHTARPPEFLD